MAGLGETCTHVASLLFAIEATVKIRDSKTVTEEKAYWLLPSPFKNIEYKEVRKMDFTSSRLKKKELDLSIQSSDSSLNKSSTSSSSSSSTSFSSSSTLSPSVLSKTSVVRSTSSPSSSINESVTLQPKKRKKKEKIIPEPSEEEIRALFDSLDKGGANSVILSLTEPYLEKFVPESLQEKFPPVLTELYDEQHEKTDFDELYQHCQSLTVDFSQREAEAAEAATREQARSDIWFRLRAGRITASKMKAVCRTDQNKPSISLIKNICYPEKFKFSTKATYWGCEHEKEACDSFVSKMKETHKNFKVIECGLFLNPKFSFMGASPDGLSACDCCETKLVEIKCPFCKRYQSLDSVDPKFYLKKGDSESGLKLDRSHMYFYQVQTQLGVCEKKSSYFVVWTKKDMHIELIDFDPVMWSEICEKSKFIFDNAILPEIVGKFLTRIHRIENSESCGSQLIEHNYL